MKYDFGPWDVAPGTEQTDLCVSVALHNKQAVYVNAVEMAGAPGIHHSNWYWVPNNDRWNVFPEGSFSCSQGTGTRPFDAAAAALDGGVLFAQSTQVAQDTQQFPTGAVIRLPADARIIADVHLVNSGDSPLHVPLALTLDPIPEKEVTTLLAGLAMENFAIALPPHQQSSFTIECDFSDPTKNVTLVPYQFHFFHALAHYHKYGTSLTWEAVRGDGTAATIWTTANAIGDKLGGMLDPQFDMTGFSRLRLTCAYDNPGDTTITWGNAGGEMCVSFGYTDSPYIWTAGLLNESDNYGAPGVTTGNATAFTAPLSSCQIAHDEAN